MKYLIFSDTHLGSLFDEKKFKFLKKIISESDKIIINGDFWEAYDVSFNKFISSKWNGLFKILKNKNAVYLYGNHDKKEYGNIKSNDFSIKQSYKLQIVSKEKTFYIEHGDKIVPLWDRFFEKMPKFINYFLNKLEKSIIFLFGINAIGILYKRFNEKMKNRKSKLLKHNEFLICGHTHWQEFDKSNHYINNGFVKHGIGQYVTIENGNVELHNEKY
jgi:predicted phosphodiesterase